MPSDLSPAALADLGLDRQPFTAVAREDIFVDPGMQTLIERLLHNLTYGDMMLLLLGAPGSGKTALVLALLDHLPGRLELFVAKGQTGLSSERIIRDMLSTYRAGRAPGDFDAAFSDLHEHLAATARRNIPAALVIDDADRIEPRQLEHLLELIDTLNQALDAPLRIMLVGRPELEQTLAQLRNRTIREGRIFATQIRPLSAEQALAFLGHRLQLAGSKTDLPISDAQWDSLYGESGGLPGPLQETVAAHLNGRHQGSRTNRPSQPRSRPWTNLRPWPLAAVGLALLVLLGVLLLPESPPPDLDQVELTLPPKPPARPTPAAQPPAPTRPQPPAAAEPVADRPEAATPAPQHAESPATPAAVTGTGTMPDTPSPAEAEAPDTGSTEPLVRADPGGRTADPVQVVATPAPSQPSATPKVQTPRVQTPEPSPARSPAPTQARQATSTAPRLRDGDWLQAQAADAYTLQLLALGDRDAVLDFARTHGYDRDTPAALFHTLHQGGDWFVLVAGVYPDKAQARQALRQLPAAVRRNGPWMRSFASIQTAIR